MTDKADMIETHKFFCYPWIRKEMKEHMSFFDYEYSMTGGLEDFWNWILGGGK